MTAPSSIAGMMPLTGGMGLRAQAHIHGSLQRFDCGDVSLLLFPGSAIEGGCTNLYLRHHGAALEWLPLLGPGSRTAFETGTPQQLVGHGQWLDLRYRVTLTLAQRLPVWFWHVQFDSLADEPQLLDLTYAQDLALAPYGAARMNEYYVSQYVDHTPLRHPTQGYLLASRQNQAVGQRHPWSLIGSLREATGFATDALQFYGQTQRSRSPPQGLVAELPNHRLQHEHSMAVLRDARLRLEPRGRAAAGFFGLYVEDHPDASSADDLERVARVLALPEASVPAGTGSSRSPACAAPTTLFSLGRTLSALDPDETQLREWFAAPWRHEERDERGRLLSFFHGEAHHVVLPAKELRVQRPHGHVLRSGRQLTPAEASMTSTAWMGGVFHSMVTQGHVSINRCLSTVRSYLGLFRAQGLRVFVEQQGGWILLELPSAFEMSAAACRWFYRHEHGVIVVRAAADTTPQELSLTIEFVRGEPRRLLCVHHLALDGDDGATTTPVPWRREAQQIVVGVPPDTALAQRFPRGEFHIVAASGTSIEQVGDDALLFSDGRSHGQPYLCVLTAATRRAELRLRGALIAEETQAPMQLSSDASLTATVAITPPAASPLASAASRLIDIVPWYTHNAWVHYLAPRGLEQFSGGGWGTRDVCQGPVEMLLASGRHAPIRNILLRVMAAQNPAGDWPQWFMFFERERDIRAGDSHGDVIFWPLLVLAQYLIASGDTTVLDQQVAFFDARGEGAGEHVTVWEHVQRALSLIERQITPGTTLAAYGHGDWNDSLQPMNPRMRERMCSAWTVTLQVQTLRNLANGLQAVGRDAAVARLTRWADAVQQDFQRWLVIDGVLTGYALFEEDGAVRYLLHPRDRSTGVQYSSLAMIHAILEDLLTPEQTREHLRLIETQLSAPDGVRLFDRPLPYHGGPQRHFQRAESATFFGREIGLMYTHAHLRYAQALAHIGDADRFFHALCQANPIGVRSLLPTATLRQANCYFSSSDAAFDDRYQARAEYERVARGSIAFDGGWRVYSSGAGIAVSLILRRFLGISSEHRALRIDPVIPATLNGLEATLLVDERPLQIHYRIAARGSGVQALRLNGAALSFTREMNPHRDGAALVERAEFERRANGKLNHLEIELG